ncbi:hemerythrin domain-containing protein [Streptomyces sp. RY43-2]|uniref:Hemerythrin domain-containing protein n=1 Tax=Streptomyces macrolidinus TaxID=2952607 RepID=A0ABT0ZJE8_9ACTN|nr:hemerythrin domain-containing protein [Streptomyces macrolidinus]MCN9243718.1 hemerythrin domain-containing protein [Streptomyces macrolidinus]
MVTSDERLRGFGTQLIEVHLWLREELASLRGNVEGYLTEGAPLRELRTNCLTFCSALHRHHHGEDATAFDVLAAQYPELTAFIEELRKDHDLVEESLRRLEALVAELGNTDRDPIEIQREIDGLAALMETHFVYEEKRIVSALNALDIPAWHDTPPAFLRSDTPPPG